MQFLRRTHEEEPVPTEAELRSDANTNKRARNILIGVGVLALATGITWEAADGDQEARHHQRLANATTAQEIDRETSAIQSLKDTAPAGIMLIGIASLMSAAATEALRRTSIHDADDAHLDEAITSGEAFS